MLPQLERCLVLLVLAATGCCAARSYLDDIKSFSKSSYNGIMSHGSKLQAILKAAQKYRDTYSNDPLEPAFKKLESWSHAAAVTLKSIGDPELKKLGESGLEIFREIHHLYKSLSAAEKSSNKTKSLNNTLKADAGKASELSGSRTLEINLSPEKKGKLPSMNITLVLKGLANVKNEDGEAALIASETLAEYIADVLKANFQVLKDKATHSPVPKNKQATTRPPKTHGTKNAGRAVPSYTSKTQKSAEREKDGEQSTNKRQKTEFVTVLFLKTMLKFFANAPNGANFQFLLKSLVNIANQDLDGFRKSVDMYGDKLDEMFQRRFLVRDNKKNEMKMTRAGRNFLPQASGQQPQVPYGPWRYPQSSRFMPTFNSTQQPFPGSYSPSNFNSGSFDGPSFGDMGGPSIGDIGGSSFGGMDGSSIGSISMGPEMSAPPDPVPPPPPPPKKKEEDGEDPLDKYDFDHPGDGGTGKSPKENSYQKPAPLPPCDASIPAHKQYLNSLANQSPSNYRLPNVQTKQTSERPLRNGVKPQFPLPQYSQQNQQLNNRPFPANRVPSNVQYGGAPPNGQILRGIGRQPQFQPQAGIGLQQKKWQPIQPGSRFIQSSGRRIRPQFPQQSQLGKGHQKSTTLMKNISLKKVS